MRAGQPAPQPDADDAPAQDNAIAVISAYGAFRLLLILLAVWTFFAGFSLFTQGVGALSFGGGAAAERVVGAQLIVIAPVYGLIAWRREQFRMLIWLPYAGQLAIIIPTFYDLTISHDGHFEDSALIFIVSLIFFSLLFYLWWSSHPLEHFMGGGGDDDDDDDWDESAEDADDQDDVADEDEEPPATRRRIMRPPV